MTVSLPHKWFFSLVNRLGPSSFDSIPTIRKHIRCLLLYLWSRYETFTVSFLLHLHLSLGLYLGDHWAGCRTWKYTTQAAGTGLRAAWLTDAGASNVWTALFNLFFFSLVVSQHKAGHIMSRSPGVVLCILPTSSLRDTDRSRVCSLFINHRPELFIAQMVDVIFGVILSGGTGTWKTGCPRRDQGFNRWKYKNCGQGKFFGRWNSSLDGCYRGVGNSESLWWIKWPIRRFSQLPCPVLQLWVYFFQPLLCLHFDNLFIDT